MESADTLWGIARRYGITLEELYAVNPGLKAEDARKLAVGRELILPYGVPFRMRASVELLLPMHQQRMLEAYYHLGFLKKYSGIASLDLAYYREGRSPFGQDRMPLITPGWSYQTVWKQEAHPSQRPWTLAGTKVGLPPAYRFDSEGKGMKIGEPAHAPRLHLIEQNRWARPPADGPVVAIDWLNLAPERMQDGWKETLAACRISLEAVYDAYEESLPYIKAVGRGLGSVLEGMAPIRPVQEGEPSTIPEALESIKDIPKNLVNLPSQLEEVYEKGTAEQQIETTIVVGESLAGLLKGKPPKSKIAATAAGMGNKGKKVDKLGKVVNAADEVMELKGGKKGSGWNDLLNGELKARAKYLVDGYLYETDELGRVKRVSGKLQRQERGRNTYQQVQSVKIKDGIKGDQGGHLIGDRFYGPGEQINYVPQKGSLNQRSYKKMENDWQKALQEGKEVEVDITNIYEGTSKRPIGQTVKYRIGEEEFSRFFENS